MDDQLEGLEEMTIECPKCGQEVETEVLEGRVRRVTVTKVHLRPGPTAKVCHAIIRTEERRR